MTCGGVLFDAYGTLFDVYSLRTLGDELFPGHGPALAALWRDKQVEYTRLRTLSDRYADFWAVTVDALDYACARLRLDLSDERCERLMGQYRQLTAHADVLPALERLRSFGIPLGILSNGSPAMLESAVAAAGLTGFFQSILSADQVRKFKTAPEVYALGAKAFARPAADLVFVSSNGWDACCAAWFGYRTLWVNRAGDPAERLGVQPHGEVDSMAGVSAFLGLKQP